MANNFEAIGRKVDEILSKGPSIFGKRRVIVTQPKHKTSYEDVVNAMLTHAGQDVEVRTIDSNFEYNDIIRWVQEHAVGDTFYIAKGNLDNGFQKALCVFFGREDHILEGIQYPKICYFYNKLNPSILDLFSDGKSVFVQSFKIVEE